MERNTLLAIVLSAVVLFTYEAIFPPQKPAALPNSSQTIAGAVLTKNSSPSPAISSESAVESTSALKSVEYYKIQTPNKNLSFVNMGGLLHQIDFLGSQPFFVTDILSIEGLENVPYTARQMDNKAISFVYQGKDLEVIKNYEIKDRNLINVRMEIKNLSPISILENFSFTPFEIDESRMEINQNTRETMLLEYSISSNKKVFRKGSATKFSDKNNKSGSGHIDWVGFRDRYNAIIVKPEFGTIGYEIKTDTEKRLNLSIKSEDRTLLPGETAVYTFDIYAGPQNVWIMKKYNQGFEKIVAFSNFPIIEWIGQGIYHIIPFFHGIFKSWGVAIILISMMIYGLTYPLTMKSMISMRKMQEAQPKIAALRERYKNDPQKLNAEMMEIYRREKINPLGGCLPFLIQMPFFMALYQVLWRAQYFQHQGFLWIKDLSQPDRLIIFPFYLPFFGNELNILPIATGCIMFIQQKISSKNTIATDEQQAMQQKMMVYILPVMMTCMFYKFASSWAIYFLVFYILSTATQLRVAKATRKK